MARFFDLFSILVYRNLYCFYNWWRIPNFDLFSILLTGTFLVPRIGGEYQLFCSLFLFTGTVIVPMIGGEYPILICPLFLLLGISIVLRVGGEGPILDFLLYSCLQELVSFL